MTTVNTTPSVSVDTIKDSLCVLLKDYAFSIYTLQRTITNKHYLNDAERMELETALRRAQHKASVVEHMLDELKGIAS